MTLHSIMLPTYGHLHPKTYFWKANHYEASYFNYSEWARPIELNFTSASAQLHTVTITIDDQE